MCRCCLWSADRKNPAIDRIFGLTGHPGIEGYLRSPGTQSDATTLLQSSADVLGVRVLPSGAGSGVAQPMSSRAIETVLDVAQSRGALVVIDAPPALSHPDGLALAALVDATYVVVAPGRTSRDELTDLRIQLRRIGSDVAGAVVNRFNRWDLRGDNDQVIPGIVVKAPNNASSRVEVPVPVDRPVAVAPAPQAPSTPPLPATAAAIAQPVPVKAGAQASPEASTVQATAPPIPSVPTAPEMPNAPVASDAKADDWDFDYKPEGQS